MKKPLIVLAFAVAASPALDAKVYSCGNGCYTSNPKAAKGRANLGRQIGSYTSTLPKEEVVTADKIAAPRTVEVAQRRVAVPRPRTVAATTLRAPTTVPVALQRQVDTAPRRSTNSGRRTILEQELNNERTALAQAQKALTDGRAVNTQTADAGHQTRIRQLESAVLDRQQNIQALQRELSRM
ncbi:hypothetical protein [Alysiella crassa]|uniref:Periplasmic protein n=1 Tax=Alysiella crassa TaxID=153491 RepID=A0A376BV39_9NEIS|nr:hypothetical protein [Alysiella crassa]UOP08244.1 coiled-coil domain-containing protein 30 [Alysiella crassa]SSY80678.1 Uncharacterised protein [Alysiella crassa]